MTKESQLKLVKHLMRLLKVQEVILPVGRTNKGNFGLRYSENNDDYEMYLDAVPLSTKDMLNDENNIELKKMLDKYLFDPQTIMPVKYTPHITGDFITAKPVEASDEVVPKPIVSQDKPKRGRPVGSKNGNNKTKEAS